MNKKQFGALCAGSLMIIFLVLIYIWSDRISSPNTGLEFDYERFVRSVIALLIAIVSIRILIVTFIKSIEDGRYRHISGMLKYGVGILALIATAVFITTQIYDQSALVIFIGLGASGLGIAYISQDFLKELFSGIAIAAQNKFRIGDWIKFPDGVCAKITRTRLTGIDLTLLNESLLIIPNTWLTGRAVTNLSQTEPSYFESVRLLLDHDVSVDRARRLMCAAIVNIPGIANKEVDVTAEEMQASGIMFGIYFRVTSFDVLPETRHRVISAVTTCLHKYGLHVCEVIGQINVNSLEQRNDRAFNDARVTDEISTVKLTGLLEGCTDDVQQEFANVMLGKRYERGEYICRQGELGNTMYIIAEGVVEVKASVTVTNKQGNERTVSTAITTLANGSYVGEMALLRGETRSADVITVTQVVAYAVDREAFREFVTRHQGITQRLSAAMAERQIETQRIVADAEKHATQKAALVTEFMDAFKALLGG
jgi:branched-chain amino acid transport system substrate-binding protein